MATVNNHDFNEEEDEEDFNPLPEIGSDEEDGVSRRQKRRVPEDNDEEEAEDEDDETPASRPRNRGKSQADGKDADGDQNEDDSEDEAPSRRRRVDDEDDEDDEDDDEEDDDDDDDIDGQPARKRRRKHRRNQFIDVEAEVDEEDEEEPEEDDDLGGDELHPDDLQELPPGADRDDRKHRELDRERERLFQEDVEETAALMREKYGRTTRPSGTAGAVIPRTMLLPSTTDPKIWRYKCLPGKGNEIIFNINERIRLHQNSREPIKIISAFERGGVMSGNLYIEAWRQEDILPALDGVSHVFLGTKPYLVPLEQMPDLLRTKKEKQLEPGMYVRIKRGLYQGDLAQVEEIETTGTGVTLRIVPRLDYGLNEDTNAPIETDASGKRKRVPKSYANRPPPRFFSENEARKKHHRYLSKASGLGNNEWTYQGKTYSEGFLIDSFRINVLQTENPNPTLEEITHFAAGAEDGTENLDLAALAATIRQGAATDYLPGDNVELIRGEQKGVSGRAVKVYGDVVTIKVEQPTKLRGQMLESSVKDLRKLFREGDHVKVIGGSKYFDEVGMVVRTKDDRVTILTDSNQTEITVFSKDLREATDSGGNASLSKYNLYDLVQLDASTVAIVVKVDRESLRVIDQNGQVRSLLPSAISNRLERRRNAVAADRDGNEIKIDDTVKEAGGEQRQGRVVHLHRSFVFAHNRERTENAGVFVARTANVVTMAARGGRPSNGMPDLSKMNPALKQNGTAAGAMAPPVLKGRDRLIGKSVKIRLGPQKGMIGIVKDADDTTARVELHAKNKQISIKKEALAVIHAEKGTRMELDSRTGRFGAPQTSNIPGRTPASAGYGRTPFGSGAGAGGRTPAYAQASSGRTPAWKQDIGARTPAYGGQTSYGNMGGGTAYGGSTSYGGATSYGGGSVWGGNQSTWNANSSRTPAHNPGSKTPAYSGGLEAPTPGYLNAPTPGAFGDQPTPGGFRGAYATPGDYQTPGGYAETPAPYSSAETPGAGGDDGPSYD